MEHDSDGGSEVGGLRMAAALDLQPVVDQQQEELARQRWNRLIVRYLDRVEGERAVVMEPPEALEPLVAPMSRQRAGRYVLCYNDPHHDTISGCAKRAGSGLR